MQRAHNRDGLPEIVMGLTSLFSAGLIYSWVVLPRTSIGYRASVLTFSFVLPVVIIGGPWILRWLRRRYLIPRMGYVQHKPIGRRQIGSGIAAMVLVGSLLLGVVPRLAEPERWLLAGTGLFGGAVLAWCGRRTARLVIGGVLMAATGFVVAFSGVSLEVGFTILFGLQGLVSLVSGGVVMLRFLRQPVEAGE